MKTNMVVKQESLFQARAIPKTPKINSNFRVTITETHHVIKAYYSANVLSFSKNLAETLKITK